MLNSHRNFYEIQEVDAYWDLLETTLETGREQLAYCGFRFFMKFIFLEGLRNAEVPVVLTKEKHQSETAQSIIKARIEKAWGTVVMAYRNDNIELSKSCFSKAVKEHYLHAVDTATHLAKDKDHASLLANYWN